MPHVLFLSGSAERYIDYMLLSGADGLGVDQLCDWDRVRERTPRDLPLAAVIGDYDMLAHAEPDQVRSTVRGFLDKGPTLVLPPADIYPPAKTVNIAAFVDAVRSYPGIPTDALTHSGSDGMRSSEAKR